MEYYTTGYLVTEGPTIINNIDYHGVDTNPWPIGIDLLEEWVPAICNKALRDLSFPLLLDFHTALRYHTMCSKQGILPRLLYCVVIPDRCEPEDMEQISSLPCTFLGFDYAYPSGDYYSAVANDIIYEKGHLRSQWKKHLNGYGLFSEIEQIRAFAKTRNALLRDRAYTNIIESGSFAIYGVFVIENIFEYGVLLAGDQT